MSSARSALSRCGSLAGIGNDGGSLAAISVADGLRATGVEQPVNGGVGADVVRSPKMLLRGGESLNVRSFRKVTPIALRLGRRGWFVVKIPAPLRRSCRELGGGDAVDAPNPTRQMALVGEAG